MDDLEGGPREVMMSPEHRHESNHASVPNSTPITREAAVQALLELLQLALRHRTYSGIKPPPAATGGDLLLSLQRRFEVRGQFPGAQRAMDVCLLAPQQQLTFMHMKAVH